MPKTLRSQRELVSLKDALTKLTVTLGDSKKIRVGTFYEFVRDIWSQGYSQPERFTYWHVPYMCGKVEEALDRDRNFVAILPRLHMKSTVLGYAFAMWQLLRAKKDATILYVSYNQEMSEYHLSEMKKIIRRNKILNEWLATDLAKGAKSAFRYITSAGHQIEIINGGLFAFKRGMHVNAGMIADDLLKDPENLLNLGELDKITDHFLTETIHIPNKGAPIMVLGTPMTPNDLLAQLQKDERFESLTLPALDPVPGRRVLMPEIYDEKWLLNTQKQNRLSFASEFLLTPHFSADGYFNDEELRELVDKDIKNLKWDMDQTDEVSKYDYIIAGYDVGKRKHPSHLVIFGGKRGELGKPGMWVQLHQSFFDGIDYTTQASILNTVAANFKITKGLIDITRGEMEDRGVDRAWEFMRFNAANKMTMAQQFEVYVVNKKMKLVENERQIQQILAVTKDLQAAESPTGHGDSFFSIAMAMSLASDYDKIGDRVKDLGNVQDLIDVPLPRQDHPNDIWRRMEYSNIPPGFSECPRCKENSFLAATPVCMLCFYRGGPIDVITNQ